MSIVEKFFRSKFGVKTFQWFSTMHCISNDEKVICIRDTDAAIIFGKGFPGPVLVLPYESTSDNINPMEVFASAAYTAIRDPVGERGIRECMQDEASKKNPDFARAVDEAMFINYVDWNKKNKPKEEA